MKNFGKMFAGIGIALMLLAAPALAQNTNLTGNVILHPGTASNTASYATTLNNKAGIVTTEAALDNPAGIYTETITNSVVEAADICFASVTTTGTGTPSISKVTPAAGSLVITIKNIHPTQSFNAALVIKFICFK